MGYDMYTVNENQYFRANIWGMQVLRAAMEQAQLLDWDVNPKWPDWKEEFEGEDEKPKRSQSNEYKKYAKEAEKNKRIGSEIAGLIPGCKFCSNDGWIITPDECSMIHDRLLELLHNNEAKVEDPEFVREFAEYCEEAADLGGFEVW